jgi:hypothetical protein
MSAHSRQFWQVRGMSAFAVIPDPIADRRNARHASRRGELHHSASKKAMTNANNAYLALEVSDGQRTLFVVRGNVVIEKR